MKLRAALIALAMLASPVAFAQKDVTVKDHRDKKKPPPPPTWDSTGWTSLGSKTVNGKYDHDTLEVGADEGRYSKLTFVVEDSDLEMFDIVVKFGNGEKVSIDTRLTFKEGSRTGVIDLPGEARIIKKIEFKYGNLPGTGKASVKVYGLKVADADVKVVDHRDPPPAAAFDAKGWTQLGTRVVNGKRDKDTIKIGKYEGHFDQIVFVVEDSDITLKKISITFGNGEKWTPKIRYVFKEGARSAILDLPGSDRYIKKIDLKYGNIPGGGRATVTVYGRDTREGHESDVKVVDHRTEEPAFDSKGWVLLGEATVDGARDRDVIDVPKRKKPVSKVTLVVLDSDLELADVTLNFKGGKSAKLSVKHSFKEGQRTRVIDLPRQKHKVVSIELLYGNTPGGGKARLQVYGK